MVDIETFRSMKCVSPSYRKWFNKIKVAFAVGSFDDRTSFRRTSNQSELVTIMKTREFTFKTRKFNNLYGRWLVSKTLLRAQ